MIGGKWKTAIQWQLRVGVLRFGGLNRRLPSNCTQTVLTKNLRELEADGLITREVFKEVPPRVEYRLTEAGVSFLDVIVAIGEWSEAHFLDNDLAQ